MGFSFAYKDEYMVENCVCLNIFSGTLIITVDKSTNGKNDFFIFYKHKYNF